MTIVVGAGLAGLTCAKVLAQAGKPFCLLEAASRPGGRVVSDRTQEGFILDRGFQVLLDSYPAARRHLDFQALGGGRFRAGAMFVGRGKPRTLENPLHRPSAALDALGSGVLPLPDQLRMMLLAAMSMTGSSRVSDLSTEALLRRCGFGEDFFRSMEHESLLQLLELQGDYVLATGGGTPCFFDNMNWINSHGKSIYFKANATLLIDRIEGSKAQRPLFLGMSRDQMKERIEILLTIREPFYLAANIHIDLPIKSLKDIVSQIVM